MSKTTGAGLLILRATTLWGEPLAKAAAGFALVAALLLTLLALGIVPDPMRSRSLGPGWECSGEGAGVSCARDVRLPPGKPGSH